jgi:hypothetical protein
MKIEEGWATRLYQAEPLPNTQETGRVYHHKTIRVGCPFADFVKGGKQIPFLQCAPLALRDEHPASAELLDTASNLN